MSKGNREAKKPKKDVPKTNAAQASTKGAPMATLGTKKGK